LSTPGGPGEVRPDRLQDLLKGLVDIYSPSGKEGEVLEFAEGYLRSVGLSALRQPVDEDRYDLIVLPPGQDGAELFFVGHLDTVAAYELEEYRSRREGETVFGLGTADMKAGCAAMMEAFTVLAQRQGPFPPVGLALVVDEEEDNRGAEVLAEEYDFPWAVVGEPTDLKPCLAHYGYLEVLLRTRGRRAHSAMPERGQNAIEAMLRLLLDLTDDLASQPAGLVYNLREVSGFPGGFVVPNMCEAYVDLHLPPNSRIDELKARLERLVGSTQKKIPGLDALLRFEDTYSGYVISPDRPMAVKLKETYAAMCLPWEVQDFRSHSDGSVLWAAGVDPIILGPGRLEAAHTPGESVELPRVVQAARVYLDLALRLLA